MLWGADVISILVLGGGIRGYEGRHLVGGQSNQPLSSQWEWGIEGGVKLSKTCTPFKK